MKELSSSDLVDCSMAEPKDQVGIDLPGGGLLLASYKVLYKAKLRSYKVCKASYLILGLALYCSLLEDSSITMLSVKLILTGKN